MAVFLDAEDSRKLRVMCSSLGHGHQGTHDGNGGLVCKCGDRFDSYEEWSEHVQVMVSKWVKAAFSIDPRSLAWTGDGLAVTTWRG